MAYILLDWNTSTQEKYLIWVYILDGSDTCYLQCNSWNGFYTVDFESSFHQRYICYAVMHALGHVCSLTIWNETWTESNDDLSRTFTKWSSCYYHESNVQSYLQSRQNRRYNIPDSSHSNSLYCLLFIYLLCWYTSAFSLLMSLVGSSPS